MFVSADLQLLLFLPPQFQQKSGSRMTVVVLPAQDVRQRIRVVTQLQQGGEDVAVRTSGARLLERETLYMLAEHGHSNFSQASAVRNQTATHIE